MINHVMDRIDVKMDMNIVSCLKGVTASEYRVMFGGAGAPCAMSFQRALKINIMHIPLQTNEFRVVFDCHWWAIG